MSKSKKMKMLLSIQAKVDKSLPKNFKQISQATKDVATKMQHLKKVERAYAKNKELKAKEQEVINLLKKQEGQLQKLGKKKEANKKLTAYEKREYENLTKAIDKNNMKLADYQFKLKKSSEQVNKFGMSQEALQKELKETTRLQNKLNGTNKINKSVNSFKERTKGFSKKATKMAAKGIATVAVAGTLALTTLGIASARSFTEFNGQMKKVQAISGATAEEFDLLEKKSLQLGATTSFTSLEAAAGMEKMALAGFNTQQILEGIPGVLDLAAASGEEVAMISDIITDNLVAFNMTASDTGKFADVLAWGMSKTNVNIEMLGESFKYAAGNAGGLGVSLQETVASLGLMGDQAIKSGMAGRGLDAVFSKISANKDSLKKLGISVETDDGGFVGLVETVKQFEKYTSKMGDLEKASFLQDTFGKQGARAFSKLLSAEKEIDGITYKGAEALARSVEAAHKDSVGKSKEMKEIMLEGASGTVTLFSSAWDALKKALGKNLLGEQSLKIIRKATTYIGELANVINGVFEENKANKFWRNAIAQGKAGITLLLEALTPLIEGLKTIFKPDNLEGLFKIFKMLAEGILMTIKLFGRLIQFIEPLITFILKHIDTIAVFISSFLLIGKVIGIVSAVVSGFTAFITTLQLVGGALAAIKIIMLALGGPLVWIGALFVGLGYLAYKNIDKLKEWGIYFLDILIVIHDYIVNLGNSVLNFLGSMVTKIFDFGKTIFNFYVDAYSTIFNKFKELPSIMSDIFSRTLENIKNKMTGIKELIKLPKPPEWVINIASKFKAQDLDGSHKAGLSYVPHDGYIAELHKGERVLTSQENKDYGTGSLNIAKTNHSKLRGNSEKSKKNTFEFNYSPNFNITVSDQSENFEEKIKKLAKELFEEHLEIFKREMEENFNGRTNF